MAPNTKKAPNKGPQTPTITRAEAEALITSGADPQQFTTHQNYHVRRKAWEKLGRPLPEDAGERAMILEDLRVRNFRG
jgi:hypothetical protein